MAGTSGTAADPVAPAGGATSAALLRALEEAPYAFDFFQALRRLECAFPDRPRWGESLHAREDAVRIGQEPSLAFAPATFAAFHTAKDGRAPRLRVYHPGLFGPNGPLPLHLTEFARERQYNERDETFSRFADIFHHRFLTLFYRAWAAGQPAVHYDRPETDRFALFIGAFVGLGASAHRKRGSWLDRAVLHHAGAMASPSRNAEGLQHLLEDFYNTGVRVQSFVGHWIDVPAESQCRLGGGAMNAALGRTATVGSRVWDAQHKFRIVLGPMGYEAYARLLPGQPSLARLASMVKAYAGEELFWDVNLVLKKEEIPPLRLGGPAGLGWTTWLQGTRPVRDTDELKIDPVARAA